jgi:hypothetical protein
MDDKVRLMDDIVRLMDDQKVLADNWITQNVLLINTILKYLPLN